jgi:hypothetical protein
MHPFVQMNPCRNIHPILNANRLAGIQTLTGAIEDFM